MSPPSRPSPFATSAAAQTSAPPAHRTVEPSPASVTAARGFLAVGGTCGIKPSGKPDLALIVSDRPCAAAAVFTTNRVKGAPVLVSQKHVRSGRARAIVCNSGTSNVATGSQGIADAQTMCRVTAEALNQTDHEDIDPRDVLVASTGIIGHRLPMQKVEAGIRRLTQELGRGEEADRAAAQAILTTDLIRKAALKRITLGGKRVTLGGICKGSGMIAPNMATMLAFITTDAAVDAPLLRRGLREATAQTFNRLSVDSDKSTSDSVMVLANGAAGHPPIEADTPEWERFRAALTEVCQSLSYQLVQDGEGVTRIMRVRVQGAASVRDADRVGRAVVDSPLVKCALHGADPNWGRLAMAAGKSGAKFGKETLSIDIGDLSIYRHGQPTAEGLAPSAKLAELMERPEVLIRIDLGQSSKDLPQGAEAEWLGCDLSRDYVRINADYTT